MPQATPVSAIIASKLHAPRLTSHHVSRPRLMDFLHRSDDRPLILVCAPAGSGKSTLLTEWLATTRLPSAWVSLDERDNDLGVFLSYVLAAVRTVFPTAPLETRDLVQAMHLPPVEVLAGSLANDFDRLSTDVVLVLDDYHDITNPQVHELLERLLQHPPARLRLAVATRIEPPWPLARLRARGKVSEVRYSDLLFTQEESAAFLRQALGDAFDQDLAVVLHDESEGWAAGLQLMVLALEGPPPEAPQASRAAAVGEGIETFLLEEVFAAQSPSVQDRLLRIAILSRFSASLCEAVCAEDGPSDSHPVGWGKDFLSGLVQANLLIIPLDAGHEFFRFHHLFQQFLAGRLCERFSSNEVATLHQRASGWFEAHGFIEEALGHALAVGDVDSAAAIVARHRHELYNQEQFARLTRWLRLLPPEAKEHHAELLLAEARIATMNWRFTEATVFLDHAEQELASASLDSAAATLAIGELATLRGILDFWSGDAERIGNDARHALAMLPPQASHLRGLAHTGIAASAYLKGHLAGALAYVGAQLVETSPQSPLYAWLLQTQAFLFWLDGDWAHLWQAASRLLRVSEELELPDQEALAHYLLGAIHYARNELARAEEQLVEAFAARYVMRLMWWAQAAGVLALTYQARQRPEEARQTVEEAQAFLLGRHAMRLLPQIGAFQAEIDRCQGGMAEAIAWARQVDPTPLTWALSSVEPRLAQARVLLAQGEPRDLEQAAILVAELRSFCARLPNRRLRLEVESVAALLEDQRGEREAALTTLQGLVQEAEPGGWVRLFVDLGEPMERLLRCLEDRGTSPHAVARILVAFPAQSTSARARDLVPLAEPLSGREREILTLLAARDSNKEIAARLFIAPGTVKRHTLNIYRKLDVNDRRAAVARATELGILSSRA